MFIGRRSKGPTELLAALWDATSLAFVTFHRSSVELKLRDSNASSCCHRASGQCDKVTFCNNGPIFVRPLSYESLIESALLVDENYPSTLNSNKI